MINQNSSIIVIGEKAGIKEAADLHSRIDCSLKDCSVIEIDCSETKDFDLTFVQILLAARKTAEKNGKAFRLAPSAPDALLRLLERGGFTGGAGEKTTETAFWQA